mgnify:FL=1
MSIMEKEDAYSDLIESTEKQAFRIQIPYSLRFAIIWTLFFSVVGLIIQIIQTPGFSFGVSFSNFFGNNFIAWFKSFGSFVNINEYNSGMQVFTSIMSQWYYFFYTGGLIVLLWGLISWIINIEIVFKKRKTSPQKQEIQQYTPPIQQQAQQPKESEEDTDRISNWLEEGDILLDMGNIRGAELIYEKLQAHYDSRYDSERNEYKRILDFYYKIMDKKR